jgi:histidine triad (HIT) family protein
MESAARFRNNTQLTFQLSASSLFSMSKTLFEKICAREIPAMVVYEDDLVLAFRDIKPQAPTHVLIVPRKPIPRISEAQPEDHRILGHLLLKAAEVANSLGIAQSGYRLVFNNGPDAGEAVPHLHCHILGGRPMSWPPG